MNAAIRLTSGFILAFFLTTAVFAANSLLREETHVWNQTHPAKFVLEPVRILSFEDAASVQGWKALSMSSVSWKDGAMVIDSTGEDPYLLAPGELGLGGEAKPQPLIVRLTMRGSQKSGVTLYWTDDEIPHFSEERRVAVNPDSKAVGWHTVELMLDAPLPVRSWRLDPANCEGRFEIRKIEVLRARNDGPQLEVLPMDSVHAGADGGKGADGTKTGAFPTDSQTVRVRITNPKDAAETFQVNGKPERFEAGESRIFTYVSDPKLAAECCVFEVSHPDYEPIRRELTLIHDVELSGNWQTIHGKTLDFCVAPDFSVVFLCRNGKKIAALTDFHRLVGEKQVFSLKVLGDSLEFDLPEGAALPVIHLPGTLQFAVIPGVELLEKGEWSSSKADLVIPEHLRTRPASNLLTQQWMGCVTEDGTFRVQWTEPKLQPEFASPNYFDSTPDSRISVEFPKNSKENAENKTDKIKLNENLTINDTKIGKTDAFEKNCVIVKFDFSPETDESALLRAGLEAQLAHASRKAVYAQAASSEMDAAEKTPDQEEDLGGNREELFALYRSQMEGGPLRSEAGWGHCAGNYWKKAPLADIASALWRVGGSVPEFGFQMGGAHVENPTIFFVRGQAENWLRNLCGLADGVLKSRQEDGSWRYDGKYAVTHFETTALGVCVRPVWALLQAYAATGDEKYLKPALESLAYCRRFHVARGAQCWEMPLHTPDPLAAAYAIRSSVLAYRITHDSQFLADAERWALEGATYVYLWDEPQTPWQYGAFIGVLGATNWKAPNWIGRPVQWIGTVYAYALLEYADVLQTLPETAASPAARWHQLAELITLSAERQVYPSGEFAGLLPDSIDCAFGVRYAWNINPAVPIALRLRLAGEQDSVRFTWNESHRVASAFPVTLTEDHVTVQAPPGLPVQLVIDGKVVSVPASDGIARIPYAQ